MKVSFLDRNVVVFTVLLCETQCTTQQKSLCFSARFYLIFTHSKQIKQNYVTMSTLMRKRTMARASSGRRSKQRRIENKLRKLPTPEVLTTNTVINTNIDDNSALDRAFNAIAAGTGDPGRIGSQIKGLRYEWHLLAEDTSSSFMEPLRLVVYSLKDDATALSDVNATSIYDENVYNVHVDKWVTPTNNQDHAVMKGSLKLAKNFRYFGTGDTDFVTPPLRFRLIGSSNDQVTVKGYLRMWYVDK